KSCDGSGGREDRRRVAGRGVDRRRRAAGVPAARRWRLVRCVEGRYAGRADSGQAAAAAIARGGRMACPGRARDERGASAEAGGVGRSPDRARGSGGNAPRSRLRHAVPAGLPGVEGRACRWTRGCRVRGSGGAQYRRRPRRDCRQRLGPGHVRYRRHVPRAADRSVPAACRGEGAGAGRGAGSHGRRSCG
ncbi:hypothetical protein OY671_009883, partial [Metschnikowia pulcherrima]